MSESDEEWLQEYDKIEKEERQRAQEAVQIQNKSKASTKETLKHEKKTGQVQTKTKVVLTGIKVGNEAARRKEIENVIQESERKLVADLFKGCSSSKSDEDVEPLSLKTKKKLYSESVSKPFVNSGYDKRLGSLKDVNEYAEVVAADIASSPASSYAWYQFLIRVFVECSLKLGANDLIAFSKRVEETAKSVKADRSIALASKKKINDEKKITVKNLKFLEDYKDDYDDEDDEDDSYDDEEDMNELVDEEYLNDKQVDSAK